MRWSPRCVVSALHWHISRAQGGYTALIYAAREGHVDCARLLLDAGADKNATNKVTLVLENPWTIRYLAVRLPFSSLIEIGSFISPVSHSLCVLHHLQMPAVVKNRSVPVILHVF